MLRRSLGRLGHQLIKEPLGNEVDTFARRRRTVHNTMHELQVYASVAAVGSALALYIMYKADSANRITISASGKIIA